MSTVSIAFIRKLLAAIKRCWKWLNTAQQPTKWYTCTGCYKQVSEHEVVSTVLSTRDRFDSNYLVKASPCCDATLWDNTAQVYVTLQQVPKP